MSRCFPFPPPGYERNHRPEDLQILKEEKRKEKKHKKEKKDKERKEGKEKKEKHRSEDKHREKKDRKGKHKDKKEKDRVKEREKSSISEEATVAGKLVVNNGEKIPAKGGNIKNSSTSVDEAKRATQFQDQNGGRSVPNSLRSQGTEGSKFLLELDRRIRVDEKVSGSQFLERVSGTENRDQDAAVNIAIRDSSGASAEEKEKYKDKRVDNRKISGQGLSKGFSGNTMLQHVAVRDSSGVLPKDKGKNTDKNLDNRTAGVQGFSNAFSGNAMVQNLGRTATSKVEGMPRLVEQQNDRIQSKETSMEKSDTNQEERHKDRERDKKIHKADKEKDREKKKEKTKDKNEITESMQDRVREVGGNDGIVKSYKSTHPFEGIKSTAVSEENKRKIKDLDSNGFLHDSEVRHNKLQKLAPHRLTENGRKLEYSGIPSISTSDKQEVPINFSLGDKETKGNGIIEAQKPSSMKIKPCASSTQIVGTSKKSPHCDSKYVNGVLNIPTIEDLIAEASDRPPHPDFKCLSEVFKVPQLEWPDVDDQAWVFNGKEPASNSMVNLDAVNEKQHVWSQAARLESADIYALPYVVPY